MPAVTQSQPLPVIQISVIIPTYQEARFIVPCLESLRAQTYQRNGFEVIVSDASSTDGTADLAGSLADRIVVGPRKGIANGRNEGAKSATGEILLFVDADATLAPDFLAKVEEAFLDLQVVGCSGLAQPGDGGPFARFIYHGTYALVRAFHAFGFSFFPGICAAYRTDAFRTVSGFREDLGISEDLDLSRRIQRLGRCVFLSEARARVSTRRLERNALSVVLFHIVHDLRYLLTGHSAPTYPKAEEVRHWTDLWKLRKKDKH